MPGSSSTGLRVITYNLCANPKHDLATRTAAAKTYLRMEKAHIACFQEYLSPDLTLPGKELFRTTATTVRDAHPATFLPSGLLLAIAILARVLAGHFSGFSVYLLLTALFVVNPWAWTLWANLAWCACVESTRGWRGPRPDAMGLGFASPEEWSVVHSQHMFKRSHRGYNVRGDSSYPDMLTLSVSKLAWWWIRSVLARPGFTVHDVVCESGWGRLGQNNSSSLLVINCHLVAGQSAWTRRCRKAQVDTIAAYISSSVNLPHTYVLVCGDFNCEETDFETQALHNLGFRTAKSNFDASQETARPLQPQHAPMGGRTNSARGGRIQSAAHDESAFTGVMSSFARFSPTLEAVVSRVGSLSHDKFNSEEAARRSVDRADDVTGDGMDREVDDMLASLSNGGEGEEGEQDPTTLDVGVGVVSLEHPGGDEEEKRGLTSFGNCVEPSDPSTFNFQFPNMPIPHTGTKIDHVWMCPKLKCVDHRKIMTQYPFASDHFGIAATVRPV